MELPRSKTSHDLPKEEAVLEDLLYQVLSLTTKRVIKAVIFIQGYRMQ